MEGGLVGDRPGKHSHAVLGVGYGHAIEPIGPSSIEVPLDADLIAPLLARAARPPSVVHVAPSCYRVARFLSRDSDHGGPEGGKHTSPAMGRRLGIPSRY